ncbi:MAG: dihydrolipoyl dehydrogenase [Alphaproteobacteria bacterium]|nr:dihydrolipoyl dehydrogenase [Alphaproteobacteria bacterium]
MADTFDVIVIGAGPGGYPTAIRAAQLGLKTVCIEKEKLGGVCLNWGCVPSKALLKTAELANKIRHADEFGLSVPGFEIDFAAVVKRSRKVAQKFEKGVAYLFKKYGVNRIAGTAKLTGPGTVEVTTAEGKRTLTAKHVVVATGAGAKTFPGIEADGNRVVTYREAIVSEDQPESVTILGSGAIGIEFAYFYNAMGTKVTVVEGLPEIVPREDAEIGGELRKALQKQGIAFELGRFVDTVKAGPDGVVTTLKDGTALKAKSCLIALGIQPNTKGIGLEEAGVKVDRGFVVIDDYGRTNVPGVYAVGDCTTKGGLAHTATAQGHVLAELIAGHHPVAVRYDAIPSCTYCQPQIASVGMTEEAAKKAGKAFKVGRFPFSANGKAYGAGTPDGFVKVLVDEKYGEILGAHIIGADATEMIAEYTLARTSELTADEILHTVHAHPTAAEVMLEAVANAQGVSVHI